MTRAVPALRSRVSASETGYSTFAVRIIAGEHELIGDEPASRGGRGLGPNPFDLLSASLAECTAMTVRWFANQKGWAVERVSVVVDYAKRVPPGHTVPADVFEKHVSITGDVSEAERAALMDVARKCPIQRVLEGTAFVFTAEAKSAASAGQA